VSAKESFKNAVRGPGVKKKRKGSRENVFGAAKKGKGFVTVASYSISRGEARLGEFGADRRVSWGAREG